MNFKKGFPEIDWQYGYLMFWIVNLSVATGLLIFFRRRKWL
jgi:magnesium transporter